jgi:hypothetical protein
MKTFEQDLSLDPDLVVDCLVKKNLQIESFGSHVYIYAKCQNVDLNKLSSTLNYWFDSPLLYGVIYTGSVSFSVKNNKISIDLKHRKAAKRLAAWLNNIHRYSLNTFINPGAIIADVNDEGVPTLGLVTHTNWDSSYECLGQIAYIMHMDYKKYYLTNKLSLSGDWNIIGYVTRRSWYEFLDPVVTFGLPTFLKLHVPI